MGAIVIDTETTGLDTRECRVVEIAVLSYESGETLLHTRLNPTIPIPPETTAVHGIEDHMVAECPTFSDIATMLRARLIGAHAWIGHNVFFDRDVVLAEFARCGISLPRLPPMICTKRMWDLHEPRRNLMATYKRFVDRAGFQGAHGALADCTASMLALRGQIQEFGIDLSAGWSSVDPEQASWFGSSGHLIWKDEQLICNFGKNRGVAVHTIEISFWSWVTRQDFPEHVMRVADWMIHVSRGYREADVAAALSSWARGDVL